MKSACGTFCLSLFGLAATLGVATYNARNDQLYDELVGRAASIERTLSLPDGAFANRPRPWLNVQLGCGLTWSIDHRTGVTIIYAASIALWVYGIIAPTLQYARHIYFPFAFTTNQDIVMNLIAIIVAIGLTVLGSFIFTKQKKAQTKALREWAVEAVNTATGLSMSKVAENEQLISLCVKLSDETREAITARAKFLSAVDNASLEHYLLLSGSQETTAAHVVALLTDLPARWLFDCATNRRGTC